VTGDAGLDAASAPVTAPPEMFPFYYAPVDEAVRLMEPTAPAPKAIPAPAPVAAVAREDDEHRDDEVVAQDESAEDIGEIDTLPSNVEEIVEREDDEDEDESEEEAEQVEQLGGDALEEMPMRTPRMRRQYKIQEVIKRRQVLLVQVVKEERGNKGAALTTYLSLAGRYSVLMPNTARGGGISRKITDSGDRKRLKELVQDLEVPEGMGVILRTAGASRTRPEIKRDFEYLLRMWETVRELTLKSTAPNLVYEEGSLIKRSIRDLYNKEIDDVIVAGEEGYREAKDFMRLLMPSHVRSVQQWREPQPIFARFGVEQQLDAMFSNVVTLKSGGYIVINQTEALVAIDVNSGRSTREHNIEDTALRTNLEAADEVARQLRLRDLAGLIVVDFIDMEENRNNRAVERRIKDALKNDRARIQVGRISHFGLLEMSRQRMRTGVLEGSTIQCPHCMGSGSVRSTASIALHILRVMEDALIKNAQYNLIVRARSEVALYILNQKRTHVSELEARFGVSITVLGDDTLTGNVHHALERGELATPPIDMRRQSLVRIDSVIPEDLEEEIEEIEDEEENEERSEAEGAEGDGETDGEGRRRRRRRRRRGRGDRDGSYVAPDAPQPPDTGLLMMAEIAGDIPNHLSDATVSDGDVDESEAESFDAEGTGEEGERRRRRRSRRGGRNRRRERDGEPLPLDAEQPHSFTDEFDPAPRVEQSVVDLSAPAFAQPHVHAPAEVTEAPRAAEPVIEPPVVEAPPAPEPVPAREAPLPEAEVDPARPKRTGWWAKAKQTLGGG
jgi:ribonuclease E